MKTNNKIQNQEPSGKAWLNLKRGESSGRPRRLRRSRVRSAITMTCIMCGKRLSRYEESAGLAQCYLCRNPGKVSPRVMRRENRSWLAHDERMTDSVSMVPLEAAD